MDRILVNIFNLQDHNPRSAMKCTAPNWKFYCCWETIQPFLGAKVPGSDCACNECHVTSRKHVRTCGPVAPPQCVAASYIYASKVKKAKREAGCQCCVLYWSRCKS